MEPTGIAEVRVLDNEERPLANAKVSFWPNERWAETSSTILGTAFLRTSELLQDRREGAWWKRVRSIRDFSTMTDSNGMARIGELKASEQTFSVLHEQYEMAISQNQRSQRLKLAGGQTNYATVKLQRKGTQVLE